MRLTSSKSAFPAACVLTTLISTVVADAISLYSLCQYPTRDPLLGCPKNTILVSPTHAKAKFKTIQSAILSTVDNDAAQTILVLGGTYREQLNVTRTGPLTLLGETKNPESIAANKVEVIWAAYENQTIETYGDNAFTSVLTVSPNLAASLTGSGPTGYPVPEDTPLGTNNFRAYNFKFTNDGEDYSAGPALALSVSRANSSFYYCGFYSYQDTIYIGKLGNAYFWKNEVAGQTDFLYGFGTAFFEKTSLLLRSCGGGITAWKGTNTTYENKFGVYISNSNIKAANTSVAASIKGKCALGRPWNSLHRSVFMNTELDASIRPQGYTTWTSPIIEQTVLGEYKDTGPGFNLTGREDGNITKLLSDREVQQYRRPQDVFLSSTDGKRISLSWIDPLFRTYF
ncbi:MAG: H(+)-transporting V0 sector ATPase subunit a [Chaenotheca gracillima]|nr:MAG: H(+)-transporting V0 sector ATPase subunit a [Chaenotheca gracillima]